MNVSIRGRRWRLRWCTRLLNKGDCNIETGTIRIRRGLEPDDELETMIHEAIHACHWDLSEEAVEETATDVAKIVVRWLKEHKGIVIPQRKE